MIDDSLLRGVDVVEILRGYPLFFLPLVAGAWICRWGRMTGRLVALEAGLVISNYFFYVNVNGWQR